MKTRENVKKQRITYLMNLREEMAEQGWMVNIKKRKQLNIILRRANDSPTS